MRASLYDATRRRDFGPSAPLGDDDETDSVREEICEWLELHDIPRRVVRAVQDGPVTAVLVYDQDDRGRRFINPRTGGVARHWVVLAPKWPLP